MNSFFIAAAALTLAALVLLLRPWWRGIGKKNGQGDPTSPCRQRRLFR
jgi:hypothetical protein